MPNRFMLDSGERAIICGFAGESCARQAKDALVRLGVIDLKVDRIDSLPFIRNESNDENAPDHLSSLTNSVYDTEYGKDTAILLGSSPDVSGMTNNRSEEGMGIDVVLTVVLDEAKLDQAEQILKQIGAQM